VFSEFSQLLCIWNDNCNNAVLERVTIDKALLNIRGEDENIFQLLGSDILTLGKLEDIFRTINNLD
jgi:hypothetical protein